MWWKEEQHGGDRGAKSDVLPLLRRSQPVLPKYPPGSQVSPSS